MMGFIQIIGYALNEIVVLEKIGCFDAGGSMTIHSYGAYFGLTVSAILSSKIKPVNKPEANYTSNIFSMIGTLFLWLFWPSFNYGVFS
jgi:ammonium transporter Rh